MPNQDIDGKVDDTNVIPTGHTTLLQRLINVGDVDSTLQYSRVRYFGILYVCGSDSV